ncbi:MAG: DUF4913 domain-containing protein [Bifidobacteriaceae bacterium]|jgi:hypothetical protein|nr:DUF4913 domain-containing protein [Bifidobacteriaceae bacterium]
MFDGNNENIVSQFTNLNEWVENWLSKKINRNLMHKNDYRWNRKWWSFPEVKEVLGCLFEAWKYYYSNPNGDGKAIWWKDFCYPLLDRIMNYRGPFAIEVIDETQENYYELPCEKEV